MGLFCMSRYPAPAGGIWGRLRRLDGGAKGGDHAGL